MISKVPTIKKPQRAKKGGRGRKAKGRPISGEEFERLLDRIPAALAEWPKRKRATSRATSRRRGKPERKTTRDAIPVEIAPVMVESWRHYLRGLWLSGLRLTESLELFWDRADRLYVDLAGRRPMLIIPGELEKAGTYRRIPITPDFHRYLLATDEVDRHGPIFRPLMPSGARADATRAGKMISLIGELSRVVVNTDPKTGKVKFASAHDLRRSFGTRWAKLVMPAVLQMLMRHSTIATTMAFYVDLDGDEIAEDLWRASTVFSTVTAPAPQHDGRGGDVTV
jgi:integrase